MTKRTNLIQIGCAATAMLAVTLCSGQDFARGRTVLVRAGRHYLARARRAPRRPR